MQIDYIFLNHIVLGILFRCALWLHLHICNFFDMWLLQCGLAMKGPELVK